MIGINDLLRGMTDETILENQRQIVRYLRQVHPDSQIVQSILPYSGEVQAGQGAPGESPADSIGFAS